MPNDLCQPYPVPVVRALIADAAGRVLLLQRAATAYGPGQWCLPGGKVDYGQKPYVPGGVDIRLS